MPLVLKNVCDTGLLAILILSAKLINKDGNLGEYGLACVVLALKNIPVLKVQATCFFML